MKKVILLLAAVMLFAGNAYADTIASWNLSGQPGTEASVTGSGSPNVSARDLARGDGLTGNAGLNSLNTKGWETTSADDYIQLGFEVASGYEVSLSELWIGTKSSGTGPGTIGVYTSLDNFTTPVYAIAQDGSTYFNDIIDLSSLEPITGAFYVRLMEIGNTQADGSGATAGTGTFRVTAYFENSVYVADTHFTGTTSAIGAVPIPGAFLLFGSGMTLLGAIRRKLA